MVRFPAEITLRGKNQEAKASYKTLFAPPKAVGDFILGLALDEWLHGLDYATLERVSAATTQDICAIERTTFCDGSRWIGYGCS